MKTELFIVSEYKWATKTPVLEPNAALDSFVIAADSGRAERLTRVDRFSNNSELSQTTAFVIVSIYCTVVG